MIEAPGAYFDGKVSTRKPVVVSLCAGMLDVRGDGVRLSFPLRAVRVSPAVGGIRRFVRLPDGGMCEVGDEAFLEAVAAGRGGKGAGPAVRRLEGSLPFVALALLLTVAVTAAAVRFGAPALARRIAFSVPPAMEARVGGEVLALLDRSVFAPSALAPERRREAEAAFRDVARWAGLEGRARLVFRKGEAVGANAFALPAGIVVVTDELVAAAREGGELAAVLAHEAEHVRARHNLRHLLQNSLAVLVVAGVTGDIASISSLASAAPALAIHAKYSRDFEREADEAVAAYLASRKIPLRRYADLLARLQEARSGGAGEDPFGGYLSSHPPTGERIRRFREAP